MTPVVELSGVRLAYDGAVVLEVPRLEVRPGEILAVIGPNGSGKSTLLRVVGLLEPPAAGEVRFKGRPVERHRLLQVRREMASVFQDPLLVDDTVFENVALGLRFRRVAEPEIVARVGAWLDRFQIGALAGRQARTLSGGEAQRVALARALVLRPEVLLLDEPFSALDQPTRETLIEELGRILREDRISTVLVTHDRWEALALGDRVAVMMRGRILQVDEAAQLFRAPDTEEVARFVGVETILDCRVLSVQAGLATVEAGGQKIEVVAEVAPGDRLRLCIRPEDVTVMAPDASILASSIRNHVRGTIARLLPVGPYVRAVVDCGFPLVALVTRRSVEELGLSEGARIIAAFKATAPHVIRRSAVALLLLVLAMAAPAWGESRVEIVATGLETPWALAFAPDGRLFVAERPGRIRLVRDGRLEPESIATLPVTAVGESGLMGLALDPAFAATPHLYACYTATKDGRLVNRVVRLTLRGGRAGDERVLIDDIPGAWNHDGCRVKVGPDGKLYVTTGDAGESRLAQRRDSLAGKILRLNRDGSVPDDNPFPGSFVFSLGHRNPQGLAWDPAGRLVAAEHGPWGHDEINHILAGRNYGWPEVRGRGGDSRYVEPILESDQDTWAPSGIAFLGGDLFVAGLRGRRLLRVTLAPDLSHAVRVATLLGGTYGRLRDVVVGPDGALYVTTSNRDGRGWPSRDDDRIVRVHVEGP